MHRISRYGINSCRTLTVNAYGETDRLTQLTFEDFMALNLLQAAEFAVLEGDLR